MGTRADFYVETKKGLEYLGSIGWDGGPNGMDFGVLHADSAKEYKDAVIKFLNSREDASLPKRDGWPWPWENSNTTDYAYIFKKGEVFASHFGSPLFSAAEYASLDDKSRCIDRLLRSDVLAGRTTLINDLKIVQGNIDRELNKMTKEGQKVVFPDMTKIQNVSMGKNSGLIVIGRAK